ncbi:hypothetical protein O9K51_03743 [Purpureocillium lavendulum]|uniref:Uncharacterized protein n=1 Tax=Purpureocillium lavendulum TaxID=1247861 RepID=A0AB34FU08_9HYPO|nr:hypothetical protein O9K51_03743 [Purpureocillium lavendulum]
MAHWDDFAAANEAFTYVNTGDQACCKCLAAQKHGEGSYHSGHAREGRAGACFRTSTSPHR